MSDRFVPQFKENRGAHMKETEKSNMNRIMKWMSTNPGKTMKQCQKDLGLSHVTVRKHMRNLFYDNRG